MKRFFIIMSIAIKCVYIPLSVTAQQVEIYGRYTAGETVAPDINIYGTKKIDTSKFDLTYFGLVEQNWAEALIGVSYSPTSWLSLGVSTGIEHNPALYRFAGSIWIGKDRSSLLLLGEKGDGRDNYWYKTTAAYQVSKTFTLGAVAWRFHGLGPIFTYEAKKLNSKFWIMPAHDFEFTKDRIMIGVDIKI